MAEKPKVMLRVQFNKKDRQGNVTEKGGIIEDNIQEILGYTFDSNCYDNNGRRSEKHIEENPKLYHKSFVR